MGGWKTRTSEASLASCTDGGSGESSECCGGPAGHRTAARESRQTEPFGVQVISHYFTVRRFGAKTQFSDDPMCQVSLEKCPIRSPLDTPCWRKEQGDALAAWRLRPRRLNLGRTPDMWALGPTRASPGGDLPCVARLRHGNEGRLWAGTQTSGPPARPGVRPGGGGGGAAPSTMLLGHCLSTPSPPAALSAAQAGTWTDPTRVGLRPDPDFARLGVAAPSPTLLGPYLTMPLPTGRGRRAFERGRGPASGRNPPEWAPGPTRASPGKEGLRRLARRRAGQAASGPEPTRVGSRPDPGLDRLGGAEHSPASHGPCTATPSARPRPIPSPTLRPTRHRGRSRPGRSPGLARARGPRPRSRSIVRLYAASVPGPLLNPPPPLATGAGAGFSATRLQRP